MKWCPRGCLRRRKGEPKVLRPARERVPEMRVINKAAHEGPAWASGILRTVSLN